mmetsp:Transcript_47185/g.145278  ORF Transcript_47185/g.145278 Transcript_47185/m.145278 type:complete len:533 (+) Transcript_47185:45-1643(+)
MPHWPRWYSPSALAVAIFGCIQQAPEASGSDHPACRKSPELHNLLFPALGPPAGGSEKLIAFGGKGYAWVKKKKKKHQYENTLAEEDEGEDEDEEDEVEDAEDEWDGAGNVALKGRRLKKKWRKKVNLFGDTWAFDLETRLWEEVQLPWDFISVYGSSPAPRWKPSSSAIENHTGLALFGGCRTTAVSGVMNDLWVFRPLSCCPTRGKWSRMLTGNTPRARRGHVFMWFKSRLIVYGGKGVEEEAGGGFRGQCLTDLWILDNYTWSGEAAIGTWRRGPDFPGSCRWGATGTKMEGPDGRVYMTFFGGRNLNSNFGEHVTSSGAYTYYNELWLYDPEAETWALQSPEGPVPHPRDHHSAAMVNGDLFVFGGRVSEKRSAGAILGDLWSYSLRTGRWTQHHTPGGTAPSARYMPSAASVHWQGRPALAIFAGETLPGSTKKTTLNDVWVYRPDMSTWTLLFETDCSRPDLSELGPAKPLASRLAVAATAVGCLLASVLVVGLGWKVFASRYRPASARCRPSAEPDCMSAYEHLG